MPGRWLLKTEPEEYAYDDLERDGRTVWDGVRNPAALLNLRAMREHDACLIYHTGAERAVVGVGRIASAPYPDPGHPSRVVVDVVPVRRLPRPLALAAVKADPRFAGWELVRQPRLSVMPVPPALWDAILQMAAD